MYVKYINDLIIVMLLVGRRQWRWSQAKDLPIRNRPTRFSVRIRIRMSCRRV